MKTLIASLSLTLLLTTSLTAQEGDAAASVSHRSPSSAGAYVNFKQPADGDVVPLTFELQFGVSGMGVAPAGSNIPNTGHHHLLIDLESMPDMNIPLPASDQLRHFGKGQTETELTLPPGEHTLQLVFADYLHTPHEPPVVSDKITITVSEQAVEQTDGDQQ